MTNRDPLAHWDGPPKHSTGDRTAPATAAPSSDTTGSGASGGDRYDQLLATNGVGPQTVAKLREAGLTDQQLTDSNTLTGLGINTRVAEAIVAAVTDTSPDHNPAPAAALARQDRLLDLTARLKRQAARYHQRESTVQVRLRTDLHAQLSDIAKSTDATITSEIQAAVVAHLARLQPQLIAAGLWGLPEGWDQP